VTSAKAIDAKDAVFIVVIQVLFFFFLSIFFWGSAVGRFCVSPESASGCRWPSFLLDAILA